MAQPERPERGIDGKIALVTGAAHGIGAAVVERLISAGATVAAIDVDEASLAELATRFGTRLVAAPADVTDTVAVAGVVEQVERDLGPIDIGVPVAGILRAATVADTTDHDWSATFAVNTTGVFTVLREVSRGMMARERGALIAVGSNAAGVPRMGMAAYAASKAATTMLTRCLGLEMAEYGVRCNVVAPGSTDTAMQRQLWSGDDDAAKVIAGSPERFKVGIPLGRLADPGDIADAVLFLASERARHITMQELYVDGGATLRA